MSFKSVFVAVFIGTALIVAAFIVNALRPEMETAQPKPSFIRATGKCAECHRMETSAIVHQYETSVHAAKGVTCLDCHHPVKGQEPMDHKGFVIATKLTAKNCAECHATEYKEYLRSRHAAPAWTAVRGNSDFTKEQLVS